MKPDTKTITDVFNDIDSGKITNASFSNANVVMVSAELYAILMDAWEEKQLGDLESTHYCCRD